jgi:hypothetical protein
MSPMESYGNRIGFVLLALPLFLVVNWLGWDERIAHAGLGILLACSLAGRDLDEEPFETPLGFYLALGIAGIAGSLLTAFLVQHLADEQIGLYGLATIKSDWKSMRALPVMPVTLASFSLTMFVLYAAIWHEQRSSDDI